jgi:hypothetical protein
MGQKKGGPWARLFSQFLRDYSTANLMGISRQDFKKVPLFWPGTQRGDFFNTRMASVVNSGQLLVSSMA